MAETSAGDVGERGEGDYDADPTGDACEDIARLKKRLV